MQQKNATMVIVGGWYNETEREKEEKRYAKAMSESLKAAHEFARMREKRIAKVN